MNFLVLELASKVHYSSYSNSFWLYWDFTDQRLQGLQFAFILIMPNFRSPECCESLATARSQIKTLRLTTTVEKEDVSVWFIALRMTVLSGILWFLESSSPPLPQGRAEHSKYRWTSTSERDWGSAGQCQWEITPLCHTGLWITQSEPIIWKKQIKNRYRFSTCLWNFCD